jgi:hypothetical protein
MRRGDAFIIPAVLTGRADVPREVLLWNSPLDFELSVLDAAGVAVDNPSVILFADDFVTCGSASEFFICMPSRA